MNQNGGEGAAQYIVQVVVLCCRQQFSQPDANTQRLHSFSSHMVANICTFPPHNFKQCSEVPLKYEDEKLYTYHFKCYVFLTFMHWPSVHLTPPYTNHSIPTEVKRQKSIPEDLKRAGEERGMLSEFDILHQPYEEVGHYNLESGVRCTTHVLQIHFA